MEAGRAGHPRGRDGRALRAADHDRRRWWSRRSDEQVHDAGGWLDVHLMIERPERHVDAFAEGGRRLDHRALRGHAARPLRAQGGARGGLPGGPGAQPRHAAGRRSRELTDDLDLAALHDREPRLGRPGRSSSTRSRRSSACGSCCRRGTPIEVDGGIDAETAPRCAEAGRDTVRGRLVGLRRAGSRGGVPCDRRALEEADMAEEAEPDLEVLLKTRSASTAARGVREAGERRRPRRLRGGRRATSRPGGRGGPRSSTGSSRGRRCSSGTRRGPSGSRRAS